DVIEIGQDRVERVGRRGRRTAVRRFVAEASLHNRRHVLFGGPVRAHGQARVTIALASVGYEHDLALAIRLPVVDAPGHAAPGVTLLEDAAGNPDRLVRRKPGGYDAPRGEFAPFNAAEELAVARRPLPGCIPCVATGDPVVLPVAALHRGLRGGLFPGRPDGLYPALDAHDVTLGQESIRPAIAAHLTQFRIDRAEV